jgi:dynein heavy chain
LCFFHANIQERKKFGALGWNIRYDFSDTDRETTLANLFMFLEAGEIPWDALSYLIGEIYYGGRVTDHWDERTLAKVLDRFFGDYTLADGFKYSESGIYFPAARDTVKEYVEYVETFPFSDAPDIFGLHDNANITYQTNEARALVLNVLDVQPRLVSTGGGKTPDEIVYDIAEMVQEKLRTTILDIDEAKEGTFKRDEHGQVKSLATVLKQEIERFNILLKVLWLSLANLKKAIKGLVVMNSDLEDTFNAFLNNQVPPGWSKASYPSLQPLGIWVSDLVGRLAFTELWLITGDPKSFWLSGFYFPQGFLTGTLQTHAREYKIPIDTLSYQFEVLSTYIDPMEKHGPNSPKDVELPPIKDGVYVHGLFCEAMRWDNEKMLLSEPRHGQMVSDLPVMRMVPVPNFDPARDRPQDYIAPLYKTNVRAGMLSTTGHSTNFVVAAHLPTDKPPDTWVNRGAALLCQNVLSA